MLMLTRKRGRSVDLIDADTDQVLATIVVLEIIGKEVRLGFKATDSVRIVRDDAKVRTPSEAQARPENFGNR